MNLKKQKKKNKQKILFDTSVQIDKINPDSISSEVRKLSATHSFYTSYYVLYEFKVGIIKSLIDFYSYVNIDGPAIAIAKWGKKFAIRELKNLDLLMVVLASFREPMYINDKETDLAVPPTTNGFM